MAVTTAVSLDSGLTTLRGAAVSPSGRLVVTYGVDVLVYTVTIWDVATQQSIRQIETSRAPMTVSFTPDETAIVGVLVAQEDGSAEVVRWLVTGTTGPGEVLHTEPGAAGVAMARDTGTVVFRYATGSVTILNTATGLTQRVGPVAGVDQIAVSARGTLLAMATAQDIQVARIPPQGPVSSTSVTPGGTRGPVQAMDCTEETVLVAVREAVSAVYGAVLGPVFAGSDPVRELALSTAGDMLAVAQQGQVNLIDLPTTATIDLITFSSPVVRLAFSLDDRFLVTTHGDSTAQLWDLAPARESRQSASGSAQDSGHGLGAPARFSRLSASSLRALEYADGLRQALGRGEVHMDHLLAGVAQSGQSAEQVLDRAGISLAALRSALDSVMGSPRPEVTPRPLRSTPPLSRHAGEALDRALEFADAANSQVIRSLDLLRGALSVTDCTMVQELAQHGISLAVLDAADLPPAGRAPLLPGAAADTVPEPGEGRVREADRLGIAAEVEMLVSILMASDTPLPLAVGLFGDWGSGKSFFMALMQERISELAKLSAEGRPEAAPFCSEVRQVRFNAWHYVDTNLWASLAATLFDELARPGAPDKTEAKLSELEEARKRADAAREQRRALERQVGQLAADADRPTAAVKSAVWVAIRAARDGKLRRDLRAARDGERVDADTARLLSTLGEVDGMATRVRVTWRLFSEEVLHRRRWLTAAALLVLLGLGVFASVAAHWPAGVKVLTFVAAVVAGLSPALEGALRVLYLAREAREARELPLVRKQGELAQAQAEEKGAEAEVRQREQELARLRDQGLRLQEFVRERATSSDYRGRLGVISQVRRDFEELVALVPGAWSAGAGQVAAVAEAVAEQVPDVQRIVLYVDDLDRCPPSKVVEVLQAVHLLLAFKLFVVVVGVDSRWLERSLKAHYQELLEEPGSYLEKIFQIPFILQRMTPSRYQDLIESLTALVGQPAAHPEAEDEAPVSTVPPPREAPAAEVTEAGLPGAQDAGGTQRRTGIQTPAGTRATAPEHVTPLSPPLPAPPPALPRPEALVISAEERALLGYLGGIVPTPRAAKRLVNIYRMLRVSVPEDELGAFGPDSDGHGEYQAVILLLAILVGRPAEAVQIFGALRTADSDTGIWEVLAAHGVAAALGTLHEHITVSSAKPYRRWAPRVARFSFRLGNDPAPGESPPPSRPSPPR